MKKTIIIVALLLIAVSLYTWQKNEAGITNQESGNQSSTDTSNWRTYRNTKYGFEIKYPADWQLYDAIQSPTWPGDNYKVRVSYRKSGGVSSPTYCQAIPTDQRCQKSKINGNEVIIDWGGSEGSEVSIDISDRDRGLIMIYIMNYAPTEKRTIDQILSTVKFIQ